VAQLSFFATRDDLLSICDDVESNEHLVYTEMGHRMKLDFRSYLSASSISTLGKASADSSVSTTSYLLLDKEEKVNYESRRIGERDKFAVYEGINPEGIELTPGGIYQDGILLSGRLATMGLTKRSNQLYRLFASRIKKQFVRLGAYYVGAAAYAHLEQGWRLTDAVQSPARFDLRIPTSNPSMEGVLNGEDEDDGMTRKSYEASCRQLQPGFVKPGAVPAMLSRMPRFDDEEPFGVHLFRMIIDGDLDARNLTLPRTFIARSELSDVAFTGTDLSESSLCWNDFIDVNFDHVVLERCDMRASVFQNVSFRNADLRQADLRHSRFVDCDFHQAKMEGAVLDPSQLHDMRLSDVQCRQVALVPAGDEPPGG